MRYVTRFFIVDSRRASWQASKRTHRLQHELVTRNVDDLQVILRPRLSTIGRSNQQRLFLRHPPCSTTLVWTVQPTGSNACEGKQGQDSNLTSMVSVNSWQARVTPSSARHSPNRRRHSSGSAQMFAYAPKRVTSLETEPGLHGYTSSVSVRCPSATIKVRVLRSPHWSGLYGVRRPCSSRQFWAEASPRTPTQERSHHHSSRRLSGAANSLAQRGVRE